MSSRKSNSQRYRARIARLELNLRMLISELDRNGLKGWSKDGILTIERARGALEWKK